MIEKNAKTPISTPILKTSWESLLQSHQIAAGPELASQFWCDLHLQPQSSGAAEGPIVGSVSWRDVFNQASNSPSFCKMVSDGVDARAISSLKQIVKSSRAIVCPLHTEHFTTISSYIEYFTISAERKDYSCSH
ncbi:TPA: hypothetical protein DEP96_00480 [Candidatus Uhrbacteria bacterium]|nr:hypothetical protein [Candidatus Uhrbacteria bacterium]